MLEADDCIDAFVAVPTLVNIELFVNWVKGLNECEAAQKMQNACQFHLPKRLLIAEVRSNYTQFMLLEPEFYSPDTFLMKIYGGQFQMDKNMKRKLIDMYYNIDSIVLREFLGRKLNSRDRRELEEITESTCVSLISCKRQFQNLRRIMKYCEDLTGHSKLVDAIIQKFSLKNSLGKKYVTAIFINHHRFETNKRKLSQITYGDFQKCVDDIMVNWSYNIRDPEQMPELDSFHPADFDSQFLQDLKQELKILSERKEIMDEIRQLTISKLKDVLSDKSLADLDLSFRNIYKAVLTIGTNLSHSKAIRDFFIDIMEKIIEPYRMSMFSLKEIDNFQEAFCQSLLEYNLVKRTQTIRFLQTLFNCAIIFYQRVVSIE